MNDEDWDGQAVRTRDGTLLGVTAGRYPAVHNGGINLV
jgi:hypothetical protein